MSHAEQDMTTFSNRRRPLWQMIMGRWADRIAIGRITLHFPDGRSHTANGKIDGPAVILRLNNARPFYRLLTGGKLGFSQSYLDGDWEAAAKAISHIVTIRNADDYLTPAGYVALEGFEDQFLELWGK